MVQKCPFCQGTNNKRISAPILPLILYWETGIFKGSIGAEVPLIFGSQKG